MRYRRQADFELLEQYAPKKGEVKDLLTSGRQEMLEAIVNNVLFTL